MIANYLIIYRVADGRAWSSEMFSKATEMISSISFHGNSAYDNTRVIGDPVSATMISHSQSRAIDAALQTLEMASDDTSSRGKVDDMPRSSIGSSQSNTQRIGTVSWVPKEIA